MTNLEKIKKEKCQPPHPPFFRRPAPAPYFRPLFLILLIPLSPGVVIKIYSLLKIYFRTMPIQGLSPN